MLSLRLPGKSVGGLVNIIFYSHVTITKYYLSYIRCKVQFEKQGSRTTELVRNLFFQGTVHSVIEGVVSILNKASEVQNSAMAEFTKIVVPNEFVSRIIGKSGAIVRETQETSGVKKIDIQHESDMHLKVSMGLYGRSISIIGAIKNRNACVYSLLRQVCWFGVLAAACKG